MFHQFYKWLNMNKIYEIIFVKHKVHLSNFDMISIFHLHLCAMCDLQGIVNTQNEMRKTENLLNDHEQRNQMNILRGFPHYSIDNFGSSELVLK